jgi:hypothetical protein
VPSAAPDASVQVPVQQSAPVEHASPPCPQNDEAWQVPLEQRPEQQSDPDAQPLPSVLHAVSRGAHVPPAQLWLQHSPFDPQAARSDVQAG